MAEQEHKGICPQCNVEEIYSRKLTGGLCLSCYQQNVREEKMADMHESHDWD